MPVLRRWNTDYITFKSSPRFASIILEKGDYMYVLIKIQIWITFENDFTCTWKKKVQRLNILILLFVCVRKCVHVTYKCVLGWMEVKGQIWGPVLSFHHGFRHWTQVARLVWQVTLYLSHLARLKVVFLRMWHHFCMLPVFCREHALVDVTFSAAALLV